MEWTFFLYLRLQENGLVVQKVDGIGDLDDYEFLVALL
jgi:hypothetical protein